MGQRTIGASVWHGATWELPRVGKLLYAQPVSTFGRDLGSQEYGQELNTVEESIGYVLNFCKMQRRGKQDELSDIQYKFKISF